MRAIRTNRFAGLAKLYAQVERADAVSLARANGGVSEAEFALQAQIQKAKSAAKDSSAVLVEGGRSEWLMLESERECATWNEKYLRKLILQREQHRDLILEQYQKSLLERRQIETEDRRIRSVAERKQERASQAMLDALFLSQKAWLERERRRR